MSESVINVENLSKKFCRDLKRGMLYGMADTFQAMIGLSPKTDKLRKKEFWALEDINFRLRKGEALGIIGVNGSGKSTLLRLLSGIYPPDVGQISVKGNVGSLIAIGAGFHPHMTGRENIFLNGTLLGMSRKKIKQVYQDIINFAEIGEFIDAPIATYSSGMKARLGFSIAVHGTPDILLVDEVLSVGDMGFRNKSLQKMHEYREKANALIYVSHNLDQIQYLCDRVLVLEKGKQVFLGKPQSAIRIFEKRVYTHQALLKEITPGSLNLGVEVEKILINAKTTTHTNPTTVQQTKPITVEVVFKLQKEFTHCTPQLAIGTSDEVPILLLYANEHGLPEKDYKPGSYCFKTKLPVLHLREGRYYVHFAFRSTRTFETFERHARVASFIVNGSNLRQRDQFILAPSVSCKIKEVYK